MTERILEQLQKVEEDYKVQILLAVESGSRAWGFASPDSDYDVRFIYIKEEKEYLKLNPVKDVIELPIDEELDINGWDLKKMLQLLHKSNPTIFEWFSSPIVYRETPFAIQFRNNINRYFPTKKMIYHYISMAKGNYRDYLKEEMVKAKKYFYVLRPILACRWILDCGTPPPMEFSKLMDKELPIELKGEVERLLDIKINVPELKKIPKISVLNKYLEQSIMELKEVAKSVPESVAPDWEELNEIFLNELFRIKS